MGWNWVRILVVTALVIGACPHLIYGSITVYKTDRIAGVPAEVRAIHDESIWLNRTDLNGKISQHIVNGAVAKAFIQYHDSCLCSVKPKPAPKSKVPWVLLAVADTTSCSPTHLINVARRAGYIGLILHSSSDYEIFQSFVRYKFEDEVKWMVDRIPVFFVSKDDGDYLREAFGGHHELMYYVKLDMEKTETWGTWILPYILPFYTAFTFVFDIVRAIVIVSGELVYGWIYRACVVIDTHGIVSFILLCLPVIVLAYAALIATARIPHPFFGYYYSTHPDDFCQGSDSSDDEAEDSDARSRGFNRSESDRVNNNTLLKHYETLGIPPNSSYDQARAAYFNLSKRYHPDKSEGQSETEVVRNTEKMKNVTAAWRDLKVHLKPSSAL